jgi:hypothetical protein
LYYLRIHGKSRSSKNNKFKRISQITLNRFFLEEKDNIKKIFRSKSFTEFITMRIDSRIKDNLIIVRKLYKEKKIFKFYNKLLILFILSFKFAVFSFLIFVLRIYNKLIKKRVLIKVKK